MIFVVTSLASLMYKMFNFTLLIAISLIFYYPLLDGKKLFQSDINQYEGMSREIQENRDNFSKEILVVGNNQGTN